MGSFQRPRRPAFAADLHLDIVQLHSDEYRNPTQLRDGGVLVVGAGNSGADIALDVADGHRTWLAGRDVGHVPCRGVVPSQPGLYFVGLLFLYAMSSSMIHGVGRDAEHVAELVCCPSLRALPPRW